MIGSSFSVGHGQEGDVCCRVPGVVEAFGGSCEEDGPVVDLYFLL